MKNQLWVAGVFLALVMGAGAEQRPNDYSVKAWFASKPEPHYPLVHADGRIDFRLKTPTATHVDLLFGEWDVKPQPMIRNDQGEWSLTVGPVAAEIYCYTFSIDGNRTIDLGNPAVKAGTEVYGSVVEVPGSPPRFDEVQGNVHGVTQILEYQSTPLQRLRGLYVYLPPEYEVDPERRFPVLYLRHGGGDNEASWTRDGRAGVILENLLSRQLAVPMVIVMTNGLTDGSWAGGSSPEGMALLERELLEDVIPLVEKRYRVSVDRTDRAIAGLSMGGGQAFIMGLRHLERFAWIGEFSAGLLSAADFDVDQHLPGILADVPAVNQKLRLLWLGCGDADPRYNGYRNLADRLAQRGLKVKAQDSIGGHEWKVWRHQLHDFMKEIFQPVKR